MKRRHMFRLAPYVFLSVTALCLPAFAHGQTLPSPAHATAATDDAATIKDFLSRVDNYIKLQKDQGGASPSKPTRSSSKIKEGEHSLADKIRAARADAKQGDIFTPEITALFRRRIAAVMAGPQGTKIRASLRHAEPRPRASLKVNENYPPRGVPLQSSPPTLLEALPQIPKELAYRFAGGDLLLRDLNAHLVVDFISGAIPAP